MKEVEKNFQIVSIEERKIEETQRLIEEKEKTAETAGEKKRIEKKRCQHSQFHQTPKIILQNCPRDRIKRFAFPFGDLSPFFNRLYQLLLAAVEQLSVFKKLPTLYFEKADEPSTCIIHKSEIAKKMSF